MDTKKLDREERAPGSRVRSAEERAKLAAKRAKLAKVQASELANVYDRLRMTKDDVKALIEKGAEVQETLYRAVDEMHARHVDLSGLIRNTLEIARQLDPHHLEKRAKELKSTKVAHQLIYTANLGKQTAAIVEGLQAAMAASGEIVQALADTLPGTKAGMTRSKRSRIRSDHSDLAASLIREILQREGLQPVDYYGALLMYDLGSKRQPEDKTDNDGAVKWFIGRWKDWRKRGGYQGFPKPP